MVLGIASLAISAWLLSRLADRLLPGRSVVSWLVGLACVLRMASDLGGGVRHGDTALHRPGAGADRSRVGQIVGLDHRRAGRPVDLDAARGSAVVCAGAGCAARFAQSGRGALVEIGKAVLAFLIVLAPGVYFNLQAGGSIFPNTFYAKQSEYGELMRTLPIWLNSIGSMLIAPLAGRRVAADSGPDHVDVSRVAGD